MLNESLAVAATENFMGLALTEATTKAQQLGLEIRVVQAGVPTKLTNDFRQDRITFTVNENKVVSFRIG